METRKRISMFLLVFMTIVMFTVAGCAMFESITPKQKATMFMGTYNSQYSDYMAISGYAKDESGKWVQIFSPTLSAEQKVILAKKKEILEKMYPMINIYNSVVDSGMVPDKDTEQAILNLLNQLQ